MTTASCPSPTSAQVNYNLTHPSANISANHSVCNRTESVDDEYVYDYDTSLSAPHSACNYIMQCLCFASFHYVYPSSQSSSCFEMFFFFFLFCPWKSQSEWQRNGINGESTSMVWPTVGSRTAKELNRTSLSSSSSSQSPFLVVSHCCIFFCVFSSRFHDKALHESAVTLHCFGPFFFFSSFFRIFYFLSFLYFSCSVLVLFRFLLQFLFAAFSIWTSYNTTMRAGHTSY